MEWLKLNHKDYGDLVINYERLRNYPLEHIPVKVWYGGKDPDELNLPAAAKSVFDNDGDVGTESGPCPFTVHGLTAERHGSLTTTQRKLAAMQHLKNGGGSLAVGHDAEPQSIYHNPQLYPQMFPWLFPYGYGGVGQDVHAGKIAVECHLRWLLMYHDKRFQVDSTFLLVAFNHQLIKQSSRGSFMTIKRKNFTSFASRAQHLDPAVLQTIADRLRVGGKKAPQTPEERVAFSMFDQIEYVSGKVQGSIASKKWYRKEVWAMTHYLNAPQWFITLSPADNKHPLCVYWSGSDETFRPEIKTAQDRLRLVTRNPVACARFFDHVVQLFIKHVCGWTEDGPVRGLFGRPLAYYGTVEQQGRMTLHLHFLLWIQGQIPLHVLRERLLGDDSDFVRALTEYIESCCVGEFMTGPKDEVMASIPRTFEHTDRGIHTLMSDSSDVPEGYIDPTLTLPEAPPEKWCVDADTCVCDDCDSLRSWWKRFQRTVDDILVRSNIHKCFGRKDNQDGESSKSGSEAAKKDIPRQHATGKGCINKHGKCTARFPREVFVKSFVNKKTGHLHIRKQESSINDVTPGITFCQRCNTDTNCLLSGTAVKATIGYITDYVTKCWMKTHQIFSTMYETFSRNTGVLDDSQPNENGARKMLMRIVNSLSAKMEIGGPMAALYVLGNPDRYTSHEFVCFYYKNYVNYVESQWQKLRDSLEEDLDGEKDLEDVGIERESGNSSGFNTDQLVEYGDEDIDLFEVQEEVNKAVDNEDEVEDVSADDAHDIARRLLDDSGTADSVQIARSAAGFTARTYTDDYCHRPSQMESLSLYDFVQCAVKWPMSSTRHPRRDLRFMRFQLEHPQFDTHAIACDPDRQRYVVPNFLGPSLPRKDVGDREEYCKTMLTLFKPWRTGLDLKSAEDSWEACFDSYEFSNRQTDLMGNFNMRYECYDARDDFSAGFKSPGEGAGDDSMGQVDDDDDDDLFVDESDILDNEGDDDGLENEMGPAMNKLNTARLAVSDALRRAGWKARSGVMSALEGIPRLILDSNLGSNAWRNIVKFEKTQAWNRKLAAIEESPGWDADGEPKAIENDVFIVPNAFISKNFITTRETWAQLIGETVIQWGLNREQEKAFRIVANHACSIAPNQLLMHLGGMGGTGKSTVVKALTSFFKGRQEKHRFVLLGPTGTSAALIGGSTYHSFLGINSNSGGSESGTLAKVEEVRERLTAVSYILIDEHSMLNCRMLCAISARCCEAMGVFEQPFGGLNVILCGDFAQLPPVKGYPLYSKSVSLRQTPRQKVAEQENTIGKLIWLQFTTVVVLRQNMRQTGKCPKEVAFRDALQRLRFYACTPEDRALIRSRIAGSAPGLTLDEDRYRNVSVITARNRDKDEINRTNSLRYAEETNQNLEVFYSVDKLSTSEPQRQPRTTKVYSTSKTLTKSMQVSLWEQPPCTSEQVPGSLALCRGMPALIRNNEATELCMTRGQEARVIAWSSTKVPDHPGRRCLDVLYMELVNPPHRVKLPSLPTNVIPMTRISQSVDARLPNDQYARVTRSQVPVLPNFAMTDYSSQGKTREWNVVDLRESRNFQAAYTALSRGVRFDQTLILRDFSDDKLTGILDGDLRQEYRELDQLTVITSLIYDGILPSQILQSTRWATIDAYRRWKKSLGRKNSAAPEVPDDVGKYDAPRTMALPVETLSANAKRKATETISEAVVKKARKVARPTISREWITPVGPVWDSVDYSCAYDSWIFVFNWLWFTDKRRWTLALKETGPNLTALTDAFNEMPCDDPELELNGVRDAWRSHLRGRHPSVFPAGISGVDMVQFVPLLFEHPARIRPMVLSGQGHNQDRLSVEVHKCSASNFINASFGSWDSVQDIFGAHTPFSCEHIGNVDHTGQGETFADVVCVQVNSCDLPVLNSRVVVGQTTHRLVGVVYYGSFHFVARVVTLDNKLYVHDGMEGSTSEYEGILDIDVTSAELGRYRNKVAAMALYVCADRERSTRILRTD